MISSTIETKYNRIKWVSGTNLHITLLYLGNINNNSINKIIDRINKVTLVNKIEISIEGTGVYPSESVPRVFWLDIKKGRYELIALQEQLNGLVGQYRSNKENKIYNPHITIGRSINEYNNDDINISNYLNSFYNPINIDVNSIYLYKSKLGPKGPIYTILETFTLL